MPEIKNAFTQGRMNKDLDERLIPNGQYRDAMNVQVSTSEGSHVGTVQNILGNERVEDIVPTFESYASGYKCIGSVANEKNNTLYWFVTKKTSDKVDAILEYKKGFAPSLVLVDEKAGTEEAVLKFADNIITGINIINDMLFWTDNKNEPRKINIDRCKEGTTGSLNNPVHTKLIVNGEDRGDIKEQHITVIKKRPTKAPSIKINSTIEASETGLFEKTFSRFATRYKYQDNEYSAFSPFTDIVFSSKYKEGYDRDTAFSVKEPYNTAMLNSIKSVEISDFIAADIPSDVVQVDILYKKENSSSVYSIANIKPTDDEWTNNGSSIDSGFTGRYILETENIYAAVPELQTLRPWDNVPRKALAQEITGSRLVYGNYVQNYDLGVDTNDVPVKPSLTAGFGLRSNDDNFDNGGLPSLKSQRNYQLGVVFGDEYGRETPVYISTDSAVHIPWEDSEIGKCASNSLQLQTNLTSSVPSWAEYYKFFVKETSGEYYNLVMDKAYVPTSGIDEEDEYGHIWISFPSSDRNKITEESYLTLKKKIGTGEKQIQNENKYKILDIKNEVPDAVKFKFITIGAIENTSTTTGGTTTANNELTDITNGIFSTSSTNRIDSQVDLIKIDKSNWDAADVGGIFTPYLLKDIYISWSKTTGTAPNKITETSKRYKVVSGKDQTYDLKLEEPISEKDAALAYNNGTDLATGLTFKVERKDLKDMDEFSGRFFVKVVTDDIVNANIEHGVTTELLDNHVVVSQRDNYWLCDARNPSTGGETSGVFNAQANGTAPTGSDNGVAEIYGTTGDVPAATNTEAEWADIEIDTNLKNSFFIDSLYFSVGQNSSESYARDAGSVLRGKTDQYAAIEWTDRIQTLIGDAHVQGINSDGFRWWPLDKDDNGDAIVHPNTITTNEDTAYIVNGLEGIISTSENGTHVDSDGIRRWRTEGPLATIGAPNADYSFDDTYGPNDGKSRHFIHISFLAPGADLVDDNIDISNATLKGFNSLANHLQGIWGGGVFCKTDGSDFGSSDERIIEMEGNYDSDENAIRRRPGPGNGQGYDETYEELHYNQWNPAYPASRDEDGEIQKFISNINVGNRFKFSADTEETVYTILSKSVKKLYNHTAWRRRKIYNGTSWVYAGDSVEEKAILWGNEADTNGTPVSFNADEDTDLEEAIKDFGKANNRRVCYIIEVDKDPKDQTYNPLANADANSAVNIQFIESDSRILSGSVSKQPAVWETEPKDLTDLNIYYEASDAIPTRLTLTNAETFAAIGDKVDFLDVPEARNGHDGINLSNIIEDIVLLSWDGINPNNGNMRFTVGDDITSNDLDYITDGDFDEDIGVNWTEVLLSTQSAGDSGWSISNGVLTHTATANGGAIQQALSTPLEQNEYYRITFDVVNGGGNLFIQDVAQVGSGWTATSSGVLVNINNNVGTASWKQGPSSSIGLGNLRIFANPGTNIAIDNLSLVKLSGGFNQYQTNGTDQIDYRGHQMRFYKKNGGYVTARISPESTAYDALSFGGGVKKFEITSLIDPSFETGLSWFNCFSFGNGVESDRIRDGFNEMRILNGAKASSTTEEPYQEEHRKHGLIYSGLYNSNSGLNDLNQFIMADKITKDLNPTFGSIQKLFQRRTSLISFCEDRVVSILSNRDALFNADGNPQLVSSTAVLGDATPFVGDYGISQNPESFAKESYRAYFTDKQRGAVLRLSNDGLTPISDAGMHDWFRDNLSEAGDLIGTYDEYKKDYNLTLVRPVLENLLVNANITEGESVSEETPLPNFIIDGGINDGFPFLLPSINENNMSIDNETIESTTNLIHHPKIDAEELQPLVNEVVDPNFVTTAYAPPAFTSPNNASRWIVNVNGLSSNACNSQSFNNFNTFKGFSDSSGTNTVASKPDRYLNPSNNASSPTATNYLNGSYGQSGGGNSNHRYGRVNVGNIYHTTDTSTSGGGNGGGDQATGIVFWHLFQYDENGNENANPNGYNYNRLQPNSLAAGATGYGFRLGNANGLSHSVDWNDASYVTYPGTYDANVNSSSNEYNMWYNNTAITTEFPVAQQNTIFNGEEIEFEMIVHTVDPDGLNEDTKWDMGNSSSAVSGFKVVLWDPDANNGTGGEVDSNLIQASTSISNNTDGHSRYGGDGGGFNPTDPNPIYQTFTQLTGAVSGSGSASSSSPLATNNGHLMGFQSDATARFPLCARDDHQTLKHRCYWKLRDDSGVNDPTNPAAWDQKILVNNLQFRIVFYTQNENAGGVVHVIRNVKVKKLWRLHTLETPEVVTPTITTAGVAAAPPVDVPAWTEVVHNTTASWFSPQNTGVDLNPQADITYGENTGSGTTETYFIQNNDPTQPASTTSTYTVPPNFNLTTGTYDDVDNDGSPDVITDHSSTYSAGLQVAIDDYISIDCVTEGGDIYINQTLPTPYETGKWYMLDLYPTAGTTISNITGSALAYGVAPNSGVIHGQQLSNHTGTVYTDINNNNINSIKLVEANRTEYGTGTDTVLRAIFQVDNNSEISSSGLNTLKIQFTDDFIANIDKIKLIEISTPSSTGTATHWDMDAASLNAVHSLSIPSLHYNNSSFNWIDGKSANFIKQTFTPSIGNATSATSVDGYNLSFTINEALDQNGSIISGVSGQLEGFVHSAHDGTSCDGFSFTGVATVGDYTINGNFNGSTPTIITQPSGSNITVAASSFSDAGLSNQIRFKPVDGVDFTGSINDIELVDTTNFFSGGTANAWGFDGFDTTTQNFITFNTISPDDGNILFTSAPATAVSSAFNNGPVRVQQFVPNVLNTGDFFRVKFNHSITSGTINGYYFNNAGKGFRLGAISSTGFYNQTFKIGDDDHDNDTSGIWPNGELKNTFVIYVEQGDVEGTIDNLTLQQEFPNFEPTTITYSEDVRGWVSFKSFGGATNTGEELPLEHGVSLSKKYFTMNRGCLYEHHTNPSRNTFYGVYAPSTITAVLNESPSFVKIFNTLGYEGTQSKINKYRTINTDASYNESSITMNDASIYNATAKSGWYVETIKTDKQKGTLSEFIEKEGKWFNYIRGDVTDIKTSDLSFQGLGIITGVDTGV